MPTFSVYELEHGSVIHHPDNKTILTTISFTFSTIGMALSWLALALLILTAILFAEWRKNYKNQLLIQFMLARFLYTFVRYFNDIQCIIERKYRIPTLDIFIMIYTEMAIVTWMFIFSRQMYLSLVKVFDTENHTIWKMSLCAWILPFIASFLLYLLYYVRDQGKPLHFMLYLILMKWPVLIANAVLLIVVLKTVLRNNKITRNNVKIIIVTLLMIFVFCFQQILIDVYKIVYILVDESNIIVYTLVVGNIIILYQCAVSILFWLFGNTKTLNMWRCQPKEFRDKIVLSLRISA